MFRWWHSGEAWAILSPEMLQADKSPEGFNLTQLQSDLKALGSLPPRGVKLTGTCTNFEWG
jgi:hypothetical protein